MCTLRRLRWDLAYAVSGAFFDDDFNRLLGIDGRDEATVYVLAVGALPG
jgi:hypothetical protein